MHVDADDGTYLITWEAANDNVASHRFYFATDEAALDAGEGIDHGCRRYDTAFAAAVDVTPKRGENRLKISFQVENLLISVKMLTFVTLKMTI